MLRPPSRNSRPQLRRSRAPRPGFGVKMKAISVWTGVAARVKGIVIDMARSARKRPRPVLEVLTPSPAPALYQERSRRSYQALVDAATELFATRGYDAVGIPDITAAAKLAVGSFYRYFDGKHAAYLDILRHEMGEAYQATIAGLTPQRFVGRGGRDAIANAVAVLFGHVLRRPGLSRSLME